MSPIEIGFLIFLGLLCLLLLTGIPIAFGLAFMSAVGIFIVLGGSSALSVLATVAYSAVSGFALTCIPLYIFMGSLITVTGLGSKLYGGMYKWLSWVPGGLAVASTVACGVFAAVSGSSVATASVMSSLALPEMKQRNYEDSLATASIAAGGTLGILIPPSIPMIVYGIATKTSIGELFLAGVIPGIMLMSLFVCYEIIASLRGAAPVEEIKSLWKEKLIALLDIAPFLLLIIFILGSIYAGIATPTEAAAVGVVVTMILGLAYRKLNIQKIWVALEVSTRTTAMLLMIIMGAMLFGYLLAAIDFPQSLVTLANEMEISRWWILIAINIIFIILGCFMETISIIVICAPIVVPIIIQLGWDPVWFGVIMTINMEMALITPPVGLNLFVVKDVAKDVELKTIIKGVVPFIIIMAIAIVLVTLLPELALWLPDRMK
ncbi:MAG: TRAP transporter large permease [Desulfobacteraceae bacterium]|nr:TRAP transporter large permease [Desulfobacteraceae bacterium]